MLISAKWVTARKHHRCDVYDFAPEACVTTFGRGERYLRLYGAGAVGDPPYVMRLCRPCAERATEYWPELGRRLQGAGGEAVSDVRS